MIPPAPGPVKIIHKQESIPLDAYHPLQWLSGGVCPGGCLQVGVYPGGMCGCQWGCLTGGVYPKAAGSAQGAVWPVRGVCLGVSTQGDVCLPGGCLPREEVFAQGEGVCQGVSSQGGFYRGCVCPGGCLPQCMLGYTPPVDRMTDACENITFYVADGKKMATEGWRIDFMFLGPPCLAAGSASDNTAKTGVNGPKMSKRGSLIK